MKKEKKLKIKYVYNKPKTPEEKERQDKKLADAYNILFRKVLEKKLK